ncbi:MAG: hypothetical protein ACYC96_14880 [Fimbriimonadaceae bacterium]
MGPIGVAHILGLPLRQVGVAADNCTVGIAARLRADRFAGFTPWLISLAAAAPYFLVARSTNLFVEHNTPTLYGLIVATFAAPCAVAFRFTFKPWRWAIPTALAAVLGDAAAIPRDLAKDSTSHNMWPVELCLLAVVVAVCALAGAFTGAHVSRRLWKVVE